MDSPSALRVRRRGMAAPAGSISHSADFHFVPSAFNAATAVTRRVPSSESANPESRGSAMKSARSANGWD